MAYAARVAVLALVFVGTAFGAHGLMDRVQRDVRIQSAPTVVFTSQPSPSVATDSVQIMEENVAPQVMTRPAPVKVVPAELTAKPAVAYVTPQPWIDLASATVPDPNKPWIAIVIDDLGLKLVNTGRAIHLPPAVTLSFLPYAPHVATQAAQARALGHDVLAHMPMEPISRSIDPGPNALLLGLSDAELTKRLTTQIDLVGPVVGINNHMGSLFTANRAGMDTVMRTIKARGLAFLDSRTICTSKGADAARAAGVPSISRDVFLDHTGTMRGIENGIISSERIALEYGYVVTICHPHNASMDALEAWIPRLLAQGFELAPLTAVIKRFGYTGEIESQLAAFGR